MQRLFRDEWHGFVENFDINEVVDSVNDDLTPTGIYISDTDLNRFVREMEDLGGMYGVGVRCDELTRKLMAHLDKDKDSNNRGQGMYRSRHRFLVFSFVARRHCLKDLANALMRFWIRFEADIIRREERILLTEWCTAIMALQSLVDEDKWRRAFNQVASLGPPMFEEWRRPGPHRSMAEQLLRKFHDLVIDYDYDRERHHHQAHEFPIRRLSVPARRPTFIELSPYPRTGYNSPLPSPMHDAFDRIHEHQHDLMYDIVRLQRHVDHLRHRC